MKVLDISGKESGKVELPSQFSEAIRPDLIRRAFLTLMSHKRQSYGSQSDAGKRASAKLSRRRRDFKTAYGHGISRAPRKIMSRSGTRFFWVGAFAPGTVGGRRAHPPKATKIFWQKINDKERRKAIRSSISASLSKEAVAERGHKLPEHFPFIIDKHIESIDKSKQLIDILLKIGLKEELERCEKKKVRSGKGKMRGRKYRRRKGPLIVVSDICNLMHSAKNIPGIDVAQVKNLSVELLAPGAMPGRLTLWSSAAVEKIRKEGLFN